MTIEEHKKQIDWLQSEAIRIEAEFKAGNQSAEFAFFGIVGIIQGLVK